MKKALSIFVNQIGYFPQNPKFAYVKEAENKDVQEFFIKDSKGKSVFSGKLTEAPEDSFVNEKILVADFSTFTEEGTFSVCVGDNTSLPVNIGTKLYSDLFTSVLKYFYLSRCGDDVDGGEWSHPACHTTPAKVYGTDIVLNVTGGWHDAGDYGRYIVAGSKAVMDLLLAYDECKNVYKDFDILSEVRFELEWMLQLQRVDGAVYHKISCYHFCKFIKPQDEKDEIVISPISTAATADFAGCLAFASKYFEKTDKDFSEKLLNAALKAQQYLDKHEDEFYKNPSEITTGGYGDFNVKDERYFALCSLFAATGEASFLEKAFEIKKQALEMPEDKEHPWKKNWFEGFTWAVVSGYGTEILLNNIDKVRKAGGEGKVSELREAVISRADKILETCNNSAFGVDLKFVQWGSNGHCCDEAHMLVLAYNLTKDEKYILAAKKQVDYLLGCNPFGICYVTGNGVYRTEHPHHRPTYGFGKTMPGMLAGGPSAGLQDSIAQLKLTEKPALYCYLDNKNSYSTNEIAIYWNSPFAYLLARLGNF